MTDFSIKDYLDSKIDHICEKLEDIAKTNSSQTQSLEGLKESTKLNQSRSEVLEEKFQPIFDDYQKGKVVEEYLKSERARKQDQIKSYAAKLKMPGLLAGAVVGIGSLISLFSSQIISLVEALSK